MIKLSEHLLETADHLDQQGKNICASAIDELAKYSSMQKVAQYVGVIGYVLKQNRAIANCLRSKRATKATYHEAVMDCLKEYQDGQSYKNTQWAQKFAQAVSAEPAMFAETSSIFLNALADCNNITEHINRVYKTADVLAMHGEHDTLIDGLIDHVDQITEVLAMEDEQSGFFKLAAPISHRSWWSRFRNPGRNAPGSEVSKWYNPFSWNPEGSWNPLTWSNKRLDKGEDLDTISEMEKILEHIVGITSSVQKVKTSLSRMKSEVGGYTSGSNKDLGRLEESQDTINTIVNKINEIDFEDWNKTVLTLQQMKTLLSENVIKNPYNKEILDRSTSVIDNIFADMNTIYEHISETQDLMKDLRQRRPILGTEHGVVDNGKRNPYANVSPAEEFAALDRSLRYLYKNPFDEKASWYAQRLHSRLWDKLRYVQRPEDAEYENWIRTKENNIPLEPNTNYEINRDQNETISMSDKVKSQMARDIVSQATNLPINYVIDLFTNIGSATSDQNIRDILGKAKEELEISQSDKPFNEWDVPPGHPSAETVTQPAQPAQPGIGGTPVVPGSRKKRTEPPDEDGIRTVISERVTPIGSVHDLIKIADVYDMLNPSVSDALEKFLEENPEYMRSLAIE